MQLRGCPRLELHKICDVNDQLGDDMLLYRLDEGKVLAWLSEVGIDTGLGLPMTKGFIAHDPGRCWCFRR